MTLTGTGHDGGIDVELYCRTRTTTASAVDRYHDGLQRLRTMGAVDGVGVTSWSSRVELRASNDTEAASAYREFSAWAEAEGVDLEPAFNVQDYESEFTGEKGTALITPVACVAAYDDEDELVAVYPHVDGGDVVTVEDGIEELESTWSGDQGGEEAILASKPAE